MANRTRLPFKMQSWVATPGTGDVVFYVNLDGDLVRKDADGTETVVGSSGESVADHELEADPHPQYVTEG